MITTFGKTGQVTPATAARQAHGGILVRTDGGGIDIPKTIEFGSTTDVDQLLPHPAAIGHLAIQGCGQGTIRSYRTDLS
jgi:hypothetical protein